MAEAYFKCRSEASHSLFQQALLQGWGILFIEELKIIKSCVDGTGSTITAPTKRFMEASPIPVEMDSQRPGSKN